MIETFTITNLIKELNKIKKKHGNLHVVIADSKDPEEKSILLGSNGDNNSNIDYFPAAYGTVNNKKNSNSFSIAENILILMPATMPREYEEIKKFKKFKKEGFFSKLFK